MVTGEVAPKDMNVLDYIDIGNSMVQKMTGKPIFTYSFKRKDKVKTMSEGSAVKVNSHQEINSEVLFQRFLVISQAGDLELGNVLQYELST